ncbi:MAG TPA: porin family protein [Chitinophagaceae bacterium]|jgi:hypothetical protein
MKSKIFTAILWLLASSSLYAQNSGVILRGGLNLGNVSVTDNGRVDDSKTLASFQVGLIGDVHLASILYLQPGVIFTGKGTKSQSGTEGSDDWFKATTNPYYIEVPVNLILKSPTGPIKFFGGAGPYIAMGVAGKNKVDGAVGGVNFSSENSIKWSKDDPTTLNTEEGAGFGIMRRFDYGLNGIVGIEVKPVVISVNYGLGLAKLQSGTNSSENDNNKNRVLSVMVGIKF